MNTNLLILPLLAAMPLFALAAPPIIASTTIRCASPDWPTQGQVARYLEASAVMAGASESWAEGSEMRTVDKETADEAKRVSRHIREQGRLTCSRGATHVRLDFYAPAS